ncbi:MAG: hypothetical protein GY946_32910 [bacterium]|nr:hypothetical protein [bacterium]
MSQAAERWSAVLARAERSGLSLRAFAASEGHNPNTLAWWRWNLRRHEREIRPEVRLAEVVLVDEAEVEDHRADPVVVGLQVRVGQADILVHGTSDLGLLRRVVEVLS